MSKPIEKEVYYFTIPGWESFGSHQALDWRNLKIDKAPIKSILNSKMVYIEGQNCSYPSVFTAPTKDQLIDTMIAWLNRIRTK
jgi:hypothetical protein